MSICKLIIDGNQISGVNDNTVCSIQSPDQNSNIIGINYLPDLIDVADFSNFISIYTIPDALFFNYKNLKQINFPPYTREIGENVFYNCTELIGVLSLPNIEIIGHGAFNQCEKLKGIIDFPKLKTIGSFAFSFCYEITKFISIGTVKNITDCAFQCCSNMTGRFDTLDVEAIGSGVFNQCEKMTGVLNCLKIAILTRNSFASSGIERLINSEKIEKIESTALQSTNILTKIDDLSSLTTIGMGAFYYSGIQEIFHLDKLTAIGNYAFSKCSNLQGTFNLSSVSSIGRGSFNDCPSLGGILDLRSTTSIGEKAFFNDTKISSVIILNSDVTIGANAFDSKVNLTLLYPLNLNKEIISNYSNRDFIVYYIGESGVSSDYDLDSIIYKYAKRIYVLCNYSSKTFFGQSVTLMCPSKNKAAIRSNIVKSIFMALFVTNKK